MSDFTERQFQLELTVQLQLFEIDGIDDRFSELEQMHVHIAKFGIDTTFLRIYNSIAKFTQMVLHKTATALRLGRSYVRENDSDVFLMVKPNLIMSISFNYK